MMKRKKNLRLEGIVDACLTHFYMCVINTDYRSFRDIEPPTPEQIAQALKNSEMIRYFTRVMTNAIDEYISLISKLD